MSESRDPHDPLFAPVLYDGDFEKIGRAMSSTPELGAFEYPPNQFADPKLVGERAYVEQRYRNEDLARQHQSGTLGDCYPYTRFDQPLGPGQAAREEQRDADYRALCGGLPDAPDDR